MTRNAFYYEKQENDDAKVAKKFCMQTDTEAVTKIFIQFMMSCFLTVPSGNFTLLISQTKKDQYPAAYNMQNII